MVTYKLISWSAIYTWYIRWVHLRNNLVEHLNFYITEYWSQVPDLYSVCEEKIWEQVKYKSFVPKRLSKSVGTGF